MIISSKDLVLQATREIKTLSIDEAIALHGRDDVVFVDLRDVRELSREGKISDAFHAPRGLLEFWVDPESTYHEKIFSSGKTFVLFCAAGWRSALATKAVQDMGLKPVCHIEGGFEAWIKAGGETETGKPETVPDNRVLDVHNTLSRLGHDDHLGRQIAFILEIDKLKEIWRQTPLIDYSRKENDAEHSWQLAMMAVVLADHAPKEVNLLRTLKMILIHDIVEIDAGDSPAYTGVTKEDQLAREIVAADRLFGLLPKEFASEFRVLWDEFELQQSPDALFARAMDRLQPFLHNYFTAGKMWIKHKITADQVRDRMQIVQQSTPQLHGLINDLIEDAVAKGYLLR